MKKKIRAPRLKVRQPNKEYKDDSPEYVPVDDITFEDIVKQIDPKNPALKALGISEEQVLKINEALARVKEEYDGKTKEKSK